MTEGHHVCQLEKAVRNVRTTIANRNLGLVMLYCYDFHLQEVVRKRRGLVKHSAGPETLMLKPPALLGPLVENTKTKCWPVCNMAEYADMTNLQ